MRRIVLLALPLFFAGCGGEGPPQGEGDGTEPPPAESLRPPDSLRIYDSLPPLDSLSIADSLPEPEIGAGEGAGPRPSEAFPRPEKVRGIYLNAWTAGSTRRRDALVALARRTEVNSFVIDIKDVTGFVSHRTEVPLAREIGATEEIRIRDLPGLLDQLKERGGQRRQSW